MENKLNVAELLKDCPKGMELDCTVYDNVTLGSIMDGNCYPIQIQTPEGNMLLSKYGCMSLSTHSKCVIFPKGKTTWEGFAPPCEFKDGDVVAVTMTPEGTWIGIFKQYEKESFESYCSISTNGYFRNISLKNHSLKGVYLATEEEKQKLFDAIKVNGYKWNFETKTLEKLVIPKFKVGDRIKEKQSNIIGEIIDVQKNKYNVRIDDKGLYLYFREQDDWELVPNKFDITTLKPFDKVLVRNTNKDYWRINMFGYISKGDKQYFMCTANSGFYQCIPYEENKHLLGTTDDCDDYFKTW